MISKSFAYALRDVASIVTTLYYSKHNFGKQQVTMMDLKVHKDCIFFSITVAAQFVCLSH
jgi:hypothetical protein